MNDLTLRLIDKAENGDTEAIDLIIKAARQAPGSHNVQLLNNTILELTIRNLIEIEKIKLRIG